MKKYEVILYRELQEFIRDSVADIRKETIKEILPEERDSIKCDSYDENYGLCPQCSGFNDCLDEIKFNLKSKYNIDLE